MPQSWEQFRAAALAEVREPLQKENLAPGVKVGAVVRAVRDRVEMGKNQGLFKHEGPLTDQTLRDVEDSLWEAAREKDSKAMEEIAMRWLDMFREGLAKALSSSSGSQQATA